MKSIFYIPALSLSIILVSNLHAQSKTQKKSIRQDTSLLKETYHKEDAIDNEYLLNKLNPIRANFKRINSTVKWTKKIKKDLWISTEGGDAVYYYSGNKIEKITARVFGEMGQSLTEYYLLNGQLSFVFEKEYHYNRPFYYDSALAKENNDTAYDDKETEIIETRSYFENGKLIHQLNNQDCGSPFSDAYLKEEQKRIKEEYKEILNALNAKE
ncbi:MAG: hypothetical protein JST87_02920 [Bacteroidetes bacterium]|nr:hypothetical protein [Bacteroidota bacterium]